MSVLLGRQVEEENHGGCLGEAAGLSMTAVSISPHTVRPNRFSSDSFLSVPNVRLFLVLSVVNVSTLRFFVLRGLSAHQLVLFRFCGAD